MRIATFGAVIVAMLLSACGSSGSASDDANGISAEPKLETDQATLDAALQCTPFEHPEQPPVLLVHGTFTSGFEQYDWTYLPLLANPGFDVCVVPYPDRALGDIQVSAESVVNPLRRIPAATGRQGASLAHSPGVT